MSHIYKKTYFKAWTRKLAALRMKKVEQLITAQKYYQELLLRRSLHAWSREAEIKDIVKYALYEFLC